MNNQQFTGDDQLPARDSQFYADNREHAAQGQLAANDARWSVGDLQNVANSRQLHDNDGGLEAGSQQFVADGEQATAYKEPLPLRVFAGFISYLFHPLFIPAYVAAFLLYVHPYAFAGFDDKMKSMRLISVFVSTALLPAFSVFLLWRLQFINSIFLRTARERIIPYAIALVFYFWIWYVFRNLSDSPRAIVEFLLGTFLAVCAAWMANIWYKISMHGTAVGGMLMFFLLQGMKDPSVGGLYISIALLVAGLVCTARFIAGSHTRAEVYVGLLFGALAQCIAPWFT